MIRPSGRGFKFPCRWHDQKITKITIPSNPTHLRKSKPLDRSVFETITRTIIATRNGIRTNLYHSKWSCCPGECFT